MELFNTLLKRVATYNKNWKNVHWSDKLNLYIKYGQTKEGSTHVIDALSCKGKNSPAPALYAALLSVPIIQYDKIKDDLFCTLFETLDSYLSDTLLKYFCNKKIELYLDDEFNKEYKINKN